MPLEIGALSLKRKYGKGKDKGKGDYKGKNDKGKGKGDYKGKSDKGKSKGKGGDSKGNKGGKGQYGGYNSYYNNYSNNYKGGTSHQEKGGKGQSWKNVECLCCHKFGHYKWDCRKFAADVASGVVHQVEQSATSSVAQQSTVSIVTPSQSASVAMPKRVARVEAFSVAENDEFVDLTAFDISDGDLHVGMKQIAMMSRKGTVGQCSIPGCDVSESSGTASTWSSGVCSVGRL